MNRLSPRALARPAVLATAVIALAAGCSSGSGSANATTPSTTSAASAASAASASPIAAQKADANTASQSEVAAALAANGVPNAQRWAGEVVEYRPYDATDTTFAKLKKNLAKYNPSQQVVDGIIASLSL